MEDKIGDGLGDKRAFIDTVYGFGYSLSGFPGCLSRSISPTNRALKVFNISFNPHREAFVEKV